MARSRKGRASRSRESEEVTGWKRKKKTLTLKSKSSTYERDKKRKQRALKGEPPKKRGRKETVSVKSMTSEQKKEYDRRRKQMSRLRKKENEEGKEEMEIELSDESASNRDSDSSDDVDFTTNSEEASAVLNIIKNSPVKNRSSRWNSSIVETKMSKLSDTEKLDILVVLLPHLSEAVKVVLKQKGIEVIKIPRSVKITLFSDMSKSTKHRFKDDIFSVIKSSNNHVAVDIVLKICRTCSSAWVNHQEVLKETCGVVLDSSLLSVSLQLDLNITKFSQNLKEIGHMKTPLTPTKSMVLKVGMVSKSLENCDKEQRGVNRALRDSFNIGYRTAKRLIVGYSEGLSVENLVTRKRRKDVTDTEWPHTVHDFCLTKPICREAPGESVSVGYGQRAEKYVTYA